MRKAHLHIHTLSLILLLCLALSCKSQTDSVVENSKITATNLDGSLSEIKSEEFIIIFQDQIENYWFVAKNEGVYKYDGQKLIRYSTSDGLCSNSVSGIQEDKSGNLYFETNLGISKFNGEKFTTLKVTETDSAQSNWELNPNDLWFQMGLGDEAIYRYDGEVLYHLKLPKSALEDEFYAMYPKATYSPYGIYKIYKDQQGFVWFGTAILGACRYDGETFQWLYEKHLTETPHGGSFGIRSILQDQSGWFWFCNTRYRFQILPSEASESSQIKYQKTDGILIKNNPKGSDVPYFQSSVEDNQGKIWMATYEDGVWCNDGEKLIHYPIKKDKKKVLLYSIFKDHDGVLWLGSQNAGVFKFQENEFVPFEP